MQLCQPIDDGPDTIEALAGDLPDPDTSDYLATVYAIDRARQALSRSVIG